MPNNETKTAMPQYNRAKLWQIILFTFNNTSTNCYLFAFMFVTYYATGVVGLAALLIASVMGLIRFFDGAIDPAIGAFIDKTETRFGKYRPIMLLGNLVSVLSFVVLFTAHTWPVAARLVVLVVAMLLHKIGYSFQASCTKAGQTVLTNDPKQRPLFAAFDGIFNIGVFTGGQILIASVLVVKHGGFSLDLFKELAAIAMILSFVLCILAIIGIAGKDRKEFYGLGTGTTETKSIKDYWKVIKGNRPLLFLCLSAAVNKLAVTIFADPITTVMLFGIILGNYSLSGKISAISIIPDLAITFAATALARRAGLKKSFQACITAALVAFLGLGAIIFTTTPGTITMNFGLTSVLFIVLFSVAKSASRTPTTLVITMTADVSDYETSESGRYVAGMIGTIFSFIDSLAASLGPFVIGWICAGIGFASAYPTVDTPMSPNLRIGTLVVVCIIPAVLMLVSLIGMKLYPLNDKAMEHVQAKISRKKERETIIPEV